MATREYFEQRVIEVSRLDKSGLIKKIKNFKGRFKLDFTDDYLSSVSIDKLRHIYFAALVNVKEDYKTSKR